MSERNFERLMLAIVVVVMVSVLVWTWNNPTKVKRYWSEDEIRALK